MQSSIHPPAHSYDPAMTGGEFAAGAAAAGKAARKALSASAAEQERLADIAAESPAMVAAADAYATRLAMKQTMLLKIFSPLARLVGVQREYFESGFGEDLARRTHNIPDEDLRTPIASVAVPAMQGLGYSLDEPDLKDMYLNLLATAADGRRDGEAHPSFAEIIKQLSAPEAAVLLDILTLRNVPAMQVRRTAEGVTGYNIASPPYVLGLVRNEDGEPYRERDIPVWVDNWVRLGLVAVDFEVLTLAQEGAYDWCEAHPVLAEYRAAEPAGATYIAKHGVLRTTEFGLRFRSAVASGIGGTHVVGRYPRAVTMNVPAEQSESNGDAPGA